MESTPTYQHSILPHPRHLAHSKSVDRAVHTNHETNSQLLIIRELSATRSRPTHTTFTIDQTINDSISHRQIAQQLETTILPILDALPGNARLIVQTLPPTTKTSCQSLTTTIASYIRHDNQTQTPQSNQTPSRPASPATIHTSINRPIRTINITYSTPADRAHNHLSEIMHILNAPIH